MMADNKEGAMPKNPSGRRKLIFGLGTLSFLALVARVINIPAAQDRKRLNCTPGSKGKSVKMLAEDGRLVEIDETLLASGGKKVSDEELQHWVKR